MNKRERVIAAFHGKEVDHVPVCMWKHVPPELWDDDDKFAQCQADFVKATDVDFAKLSADKYFGWPAPVLDGIEKAEDLYKIEPLGADHPFIRGQIERTRKIIQGLNGECVALYLIFAPLSYLRLQVGYPTMMKLIRENPEAMKYACSVIAEDVKVLVHGIIEEAGADGIFFSVQNAEENRFTYEEYRAWVTPSEKAVLDYANTLSSMNAIHLCAWEEIPNRLSVWADYKAAVISWSRYIDIMDIQEAKKHFGCTCGAALTTAWAPSSIRLLARSWSRRLPICSLRAARRATSSVLIAASTAVCPKSASVGLQKRPARSDSPQ